LENRGPPSLPSFHDGWLTSISVGEKTATLGLTRSCGSTFELTLDNVIALHAEDFRQGNIVFSVEVISGKEPDCYRLDGFLERLFGSPHPDAPPEYHARHAEFRSDVLQRISRGGATLIVIGASYGCGLVAICHSIRLTQLHGANAPPAID
jgi:hypothetical protein